MTEALEPSLNAPTQRFWLYPEYKDSGVEWLSEIPVHWNLRGKTFY